MIYDELYTGYNWGIGHGQWTLPIIRIPIDTVPFTNSYYLGWVKYENMPFSWKTSVYYFDSNAGMLSFNDLTVQQNVSIGYFGYSGGIPTLGKNFKYLANAAPSGYSGYDNRWGCTWLSEGDPIDNDGARLLNKWKPLGASYKVLSLTFYCLHTWNNLYYGDYATVNNLTIKQFIDFMNGSSTLSLSFASGINYTLTGTDFENGFYYDEPNDRKVIITGYEFTPNMFYNNENDLESGYFGGVYGQSDYFYDDVKSECISSGTRVEKTWTTSNYRMIFGFRNFSTIGTSWTICADKTTSANSNINVPQSTPFGGLITGNVSSEDISSLTEYGMYLELENNNYLILNNESDGTMYKIVHGYTAQDIYKHAALFRWTHNSKQYGYENEVVYFPKIDLETDEFLCELITGTKEEVEPQLPLWFRRDDPTLSEYDDTKKPEPTPPTPEDDDSSGDNITPYNFVNTPLGAANNFITLYSLNTAQVADFGRRMWASLSDTAFWETVGTVFLNDFSINPADMMKYFVSLRYFPFDLSIVHSSQTWGIYIGRSSYPIQPSIGTELPHRITRNLVQLDGGSVFVPNHYNDFRDYEPYTKVSVTVPFCGVLELTPSEVVGKTLYLDYVIDLQTGTIKATVSVQSNTFFIVGSLSGVCGSQIPLTANNNIEFLQRIANVGSSIISSGSSAESAADKVAGLTGSGAIGAVAGGVVIGANAVGSMLSLPPITVHKQGNATGFANYGGSSQAYLTVQRQKYIVPDNYGHSVGYATAFSSVLSSLSGFTVCSNVDLSGFTCHEDERSEIKALLESGVYL